MASGIISYFEFSVNMACTKSISCQYEHLLFGYPENYTKHHIYRKKHT